MDQAPSAEVPNGSRLERAATGLRATLAGLALYTGLLGLLFLLAQDLAAALLAITIHDPVAFRQWGAALIMLALLAALLAGNPLRHRRLLLVPLLGLPLDSLVLVYELASGASGFRQLGAPLVINLALFAPLLLFYRRATAALADELSGPGPADDRWRPFLKRKITE